MGDGLGLGETLGSSLTSKIDPDGNCDKSKTLTKL